MTISAPLPETIEAATHRKNLRILVTLRGAAFCAQAVAILVASYGFSIVLPVTAMFGVAAILVAFNLYSLYRLRSAAQVRVGDLFIGLVADIGVLTAQLAFSGGTANPFVSFYMLPVIIGAVMLSARYAWAIYGLTLLGYCVLAVMSFNAPMPKMPGMEMPGMAMTGLVDRFNLHMHGMMLGYALSAGLLVFVITRIRANLQARDAELIAVRTQALQEDHIVRLGLLAAGAAHELGTPLTTLSVILNDLRDLPLPRRKADLLGDVDTMQNQVDRCKAIVSGILASTGQTRGEGGESRSLPAFIEGLSALWRASHPSAELSVTAALDDIPILADRVIEQAVLNLLDNAYEASQRRGSGFVGLAAVTKDDTLILDIEDRGDGFDAEVMTRIGLPYATTKMGDGRGLGLFLAGNTLRVLGGRLDIQNRDDGARVRLTLPLAAIRLGADV